MGLLSKNKIQGDGCSTQGTVAKEEDKNEEDIDHKAASEELKPPDETAPETNSKVEIEDFANTKGNT